MKTPGRAVAAALLAALCACGSRVAAASAAEPQPANVTIAFSGDVNGYLEPCG